MPAITTKLFDVRQGNNAAKDAVIDAFADVYGWEDMDAATRPNRQAFFNQEL